MSNEFDGLMVTISGPLAAIAKFQPLLEALDGSLTMPNAAGNSVGEIGVIRWAGRSARPRSSGIRGPKRKAVR